MLTLNVDNYKKFMVMGHESFKTTMDTYGHLYPEESDHLVRGLQDLRPSISPQEQTRQNEEEVS